MLDPAHADVCAMLGSAADGGNVPDLLSDDFVIMPHASARVPFPHGFFGRGVEITLRPGDESGSWTVEETDYGAPEPRGPEPFTVEHEGTAFEGEWQIAGRELHFHLAHSGSAVPFRNYGDPAAAARDRDRDVVRLRWQTTPLAGLPPQGRSRGMSPKTRVPDAAARSSIRRSDRLVQESALAPDSDHLGRGRGAG